MSVNPTPSGGLPGELAQQRPANMVFWRDRGALTAGAVLLLIAVAAWVFMVQQAAGMGPTDMAMPGGTGVFSWEGLAVYVLAWGVMMAAMMLPSAIPMIALYQKMSRGDGSRGRRVVPTALFAAVYLVVWLLFGVPVYGANLAVDALVSVTGTTVWLPYALATVLLAGGAYQFSAIKRMCLRYCQSPLLFLMTRWRSGYAATLRLGLTHAAYCVGCCWGLMVILVAAGAMSLPWVLGVATVVFAEKLLPMGGRMGQVVGALLIVLGLAVALRPEFAITLRGGVPPTPMEAPQSPMGLMGM